MKQDEKQLLLFDLSVRVPHKVIVKATYKDGEGWKIEDRKLLGIYSNGQVYLDSTYTEVEKIKPYLRPLSSMTKEEAKDIATLMGIKDIISINITEKYIDVIKDDGFCSTETITIWFNEIVSSIEIFDYLNVHCFDYRDLIPMGLAIEVTEENNPYKENDTRTSKTNL